MHISTILNNWVNFNNNYRNHLEHINHPISIIFTDKGDSIIEWSLTDKTFYKNSDDLFKTVENFLSTISKLLALKLEK